VAKSPAPRPQDSLRQLLLLRGSHARASADARPNRPREPC
jgi:hypothetical protein